MKHRLRIFLILTFCFTTICIAQNCYQTNLDIGIEKFNSADYKEAIDNFENAKKCSDSKGAKTPNSWIGKCNTRLSEIETVRLNKIEETKDLKAFEKAQSIDSEYAYKDYLSSYPSGNFVSQAKSGLKLLIDERDLKEFNSSKISNTKKGYRSYLQKYPDGNWIKQAKQRITEIENIEIDAYNKTVKENTLKSYAAYQKKYPNSIKNDILQKRIEDLTFSKRITMGNFPPYSYSISSSNASNNFIAVASNKVLKRNKGLKLYLLTDGGKVVKEEKLIKGDYTFEADVKSANKNQFIVLANYESKSTKGYWVFGYNNKLLWEKTYDYGEEDYATHLIISKDGSFFVIGEKAVTNSKAKNTNTFITKLDKQGNFIWNKTYGGKKLDVITSVVLSSDNNLILAGVTKSKNINNSENLWVLKVSQNGEVIWEKSYGGDYDDYASSIAETNNKDLVVVGYSESLGQSNGKTWVLKIDSDGDKIWSKAYDTYDLSYPNIMSVNNGNIIVSTAAESKQGVVLLNLDSKGEPLFSKHFKTYGAGKEITKLISKNDKTLYAFGESIDNSQAIWMFKLDANLDINQKFNKITVNDISIKEFKREAINSKNWKEKYEEVEVLIPNEMYQVKINKRFGIVDSQGKEIAPCIYEKFTYHENKYYPETSQYKLVSSITDDRLILFNNSGKQIISAQQNLSAFYGVRGAYGSNMLRVQNSKYLWGCINVITGDMVIPTIYNGMFAWSEKKGEWMIEVSYNSEMKKSFVLNQKGECIKHCKNKIK